MFRMNLKITYGLSLIELLTVLAITSMATLGATHIHEVHNKQRLDNSQSSLSLLIRRARHDALILQTRITLCALSEVGACKPDWSGPLSVFTDHNGNRKLDSNELEISRIDLHPNVLVSWKGMKPNNSIHFSPGGVTFVSNGTFTLCHPRHHEAVKLIINKQGRPKSERISQTCQN